MIDQLSVFLPNKKGTLSTVAGALSDAGINMHVLVIADTAEYGIVRIVCDTPHAAARALSDAGLRATTTPVYAVRVPNTPGGLTQLLAYCEEKGLNIEYGYCFLLGEEGAIDVLKIDASAEDVLEAGGFEMVEPEEIYRVDEA